MPPQSQIVFWIQKASGFFLRLKNSGPSPLLLVKALPVIIPPRPMPRNASRPEEQ
jgi:hypothetical protein